MHTLESMQSVAVHAAVKVKLAVHAAVKVKLAVHISSEVLIIM